MTYREFELIKKALEKASGEIQFTLTKAIADIERIKLEDNWKTNETI